MISQSLIAFSPETNCKIVRISALVRSFEHIRNWFLYKMFFPSGCAVFKVQFRPSRFARWLPARIFQILCAFRFAFAHPPKVRFSLFAIPENDTGSRRRTVIRPLRFCFVDFLPLRLLLFRAPHSFRCDRPGMNLRVSSSILSLERR